MKGARGLAVEDTGAVRRPESWRVLFRSRPLLVFAAAAAIFHFANGPLLLLVAQKLALAHPGYETGLTSAAIIITQLATIPMALLVTRANALGRKPLAIIAFAAVPLRGLLCASSDNPSRLLGVQLLDGVGAGMYDALLPLLLADMMRGTGRYSLARGMLGTIQGIRRFDRIGRGRLHRRGVWLQRGLPHSRRRRRGGPARVGRRHAGNEADPREAGSATSGEWT